MILALVPKLAQMILLLMLVIIHSPKKVKAKQTHRRQKPRNRAWRLHFTCLKGVVRAHPFLNDKVIFAGQSQCFAAQSQCFSSSNASKNCPRPAQLDLFPHSKRKQRRKRPESNGPTFPRNKPPSHARRYRMSMHGGTRSCLGFPTI